MFTLSWRSLSFSGGLHGLLALLTHTAKLLVKIEALAAVAYLLFACLEHVDEAIVTG